MSVYYRWSDNDRRWGRVIYAHGPRNDVYRPLAVELNSQGDEDDDGSFNTLRLSAFGHTLIVLLPQIIKPWKRWVDTSHYGWSDNPRGGYWDMGKREYGFSINDGHLSVSLGRVTNDSSTEQRWGYFLPWTQWRHVRHSWYGLRGELLWSQFDKDRAKKSKANLNGVVFAMPDWFEQSQAMEKATPAAAFVFTDYDGEQLIATTRIGEREWRRGTGWFRFLSLVWPKKVHRALDIRFSGETGKRKGSWKGGTIGTGIDMLPGELHAAAFERYCVKNGMKFAGPAA